MVGSILLIFYWNFEKKKLHLIATFTCKVVVSYRSLNVENVSWYNSGIFKNISVTFVAVEKFWSIARTIM